MNDKNKTGNPHFTKISNRNITDTYPKTPTEKPTIKQIPTYTKSSSSWANPSSNKLNSNVSVDKIDTLPPIPLYTSTSANTAAHQIAAAANQHDNLSISDNQNVIIFNDNTQVGGMVSQNHLPVLLRLLQTKKLHLLNKQLFSTL
ncbi:unnamed protein product [Macrosiphum euphorbiae]|uniref:Uncharacterized protein n=1 Tax=Macrosiphum euphorbiae TaxID=13131 RepID=A0AAV0W5F1_9HEMI|nr:unnamed protein product [Macrosiphum euphorbiae]